MRTAPHNDDAEKALLGAILMNEEAYDSVSQLVSASDFYHPANAEIFVAIQRMKETSSFAVDIIMLTDFLRKNGKLDAAGGLGYISSLTESESIYSNAEQYASIVKELSLRRSMISISSNMAELAGDDKNDVYALLDESETRLMKLSENGSTSNESYAVSAAVTDLMERIQLKMDGKLADDAVATGFSVLDKYCNGGFHPEDYVVIAARPSIGKTAFAVSMIRNMLSDSRNIAFFSLEMPARQITVRLLANISRVEANKITNGDFGEGEFIRVMDAANNLYSKSLYIVDVPNIKLGDLRAKARSLKREKKIDCILIDYIGLVDPGLDQRTPRHEVIATVSKSLKQLARELKIPIVVLCQVSRDSEEREPILSNLRDSGSIEQDADIVMFLHRKRVLTEEEKSQNAKDRDGRPVLQTTMVIVAKQRNGETGSFKVGYNAATTSFEEVQQDSVFFKPDAPDKRK